MEGIKLAEYCVNELIKLGVDKSQCYIEEKVIKQFKVNDNNITLLKTIFNKEIKLVVIKNNKKAILSIDDNDEGELKKAFQNIIVLCESASEDECNDIAEYQPPKHLDYGVKENNFDLMMKRLTDLLDYNKNNYPNNKLEITYSFNNRNRFFYNSNNVEFSSSRRYYDFVLLLSAKNNESSGPFNWTDFLTINLDKDIKDIGTVNILLKQATKELKTTRLNDKFVGDLILDSDAIRAFLKVFINTFFKKKFIISGTNPLTNKLNEKIASDKLTISSKPLSNEVSDGYFFTRDGYEAKDITLINKGVLKSFVLDLYTSKKTGNNYTYNQGESYLVEPGKISYEDMIKSVKKGILISSFQIGSPQLNGDFSINCLNSYYIENGKKLYPIENVIITGNMFEMILNIKAISKEIIDNGYHKTPSHIQFTDIHISGEKYV